MIWTAICSREAPRTVPTLRYCGGIWSTPEIRPLMMDGMAPINTTKYTVASVRPNQMMAAGTNATDGRTCSPEISGPNARRSGATCASSAAIGSRTRLQSTRALRAASDCRESSPDSSSRRSAEPVEDRVRAAWILVDSVEAGVTGSTTGAGAASGAESERNLLGMAADLLSQPGGDDPGQLSCTTGVGTVFFGDCPFLHHAAGPGGQQQHALAQADCLADVVRHEDDGAPGFLPDALKFVVEQVPGNGIQG